jgi:hypothetical protein
MIITAASAFIIGLYAFVHGLRALGEIALMIAVCCAASISGPRPARAAIV